MGTVSDVPIIFNTYQKLAVIEDEGITTECFVDAYPKANITWFSPLGQGLATFIEEKIVNETVYSSILHCKFIDILLLFSKYLI